jgi:hypothetical protein
VDALKLDVDGPVKNAVFISAVGAGGELSQLALWDFLKIFFFFLVFFFPSPKF